MADEVLPIPLDSLIHTVAELLRQQGHDQAVDVLETAEARLEQTGYDNWNGGTSFYTLSLDLPVRQFAKVESDTEQIEKAISSRLSTVLDAAGPYEVERVCIHPKIEAAASPRTRPAEADVQHVWESGRFRLFLSHVAAHKVAVSAVKDALGILGVSAFVATVGGCQTTGSGTTVVQASTPVAVKLGIASHLVHGCVAVLVDSFASRVPGAAAVLAELEVEAGAIRAAQPDATQHRPDQDATAAGLAGTQVDVVAGGTTAVAVALARSRTSPLLAARTGRKLGARPGSAPAAAQALGVRTAVGSDPALAGAADAVGTGCAVKGDRVAARPRARVAEVLGAWIAVDAVLGN